MQEGINPNQDQDEVFLKKEGDHWYQRNKSNLLKEEKRKNDPVLHMLQSLPWFKPRNVLEVGCANGWRLDEVAKRYESTSAVSVTGLEPSAQAIEEGSKAYPSVKFVQGVGTALPFSEKTFDCLIVHFVFHWIDRSNLLKTVSEIDRVLTHNGLLIIGDFLPDMPSKRRYHHRTDLELFTYKQDYAKIFTSSALYSLVAATTFNHDQPGMRPGPADRGGVTALLKSENGIYKFE